MPRCAESRNEDFFIALATGFITVCSMPRRASLWMRSSAQISRSTRRKSRNWKKHRATSANGLSITLQQLSVRLFAFLSSAIVYALLEKADLSAAIFSGEERRHPDASVRIISAFAELRQAMFKHIQDEAQRGVFLTRLLAECGVIFRLVNVQPID